MSMVEGVSSRRVFQVLWTTNHRARRACLGVRYHPLDGTATSIQVAYAIPKQVGGAVERNRLRRQLRAIVAELAPSLPSGAFLITATAAAVDVAYAELRSELTLAVAQVSRAAA